MSVFLLSQSIYRGDLRSAGVTRFIARPLRHTGPHHSRRGHPWISFHIDPGTRVLPLRIFPQELFDSSLAWLFTCRCATRCCLRPRGVSFVLVYNVLTTWPAPDKRGSALSQNSKFSELCVRFRATPFTSLHLLLLLSVSFFRSFQLLSG